jgi:hypothetical protein
MGPGIEMLGFSFPCAYKQVLKLQELQLTNFLLALLCHFLGVFGKLKRLNKFLDITI